MKVLVAIAATLLCIGGSTSCLAAPTTPQSQTLTEGQLAVLLRAGNHLPNARRVAFYERWDNVPQGVVGSLEIFKAQKNAIEQVKARKLVNLIPALIPYLDYPSEGAMRDTPPINGGLLFETLRLWPAFSAIYSFGQEAVVPLSATIRSSDKDMRLRITALQVLMNIDQAKGRVEGEKLAESALQAKQQPLAELVGNIINDKKPFWGIVDFQPITMSAEEVAEWLRTDRHLDAHDVRMAMRWPIFPLPDDPQPKKDAARALSETYHKQKEAMRNAGDLKLIKLVPELLLYLDYPADGGAYILSAGSYSLGRRRQNWPALDAILKMGVDAIVPVQNVLSDKAQPMQLRLAALSVLHDLAPEKAVAPGQLLLDEAKQTGDEKSQKSIEFILERSDNTSPLSVLRKMNQAPQTK